MAATSSSKKGTPPRPREHFLLQEAVHRGDRAAVERVLAANSYAVLDAQERAHARGSHGLLHKAAYRGHDGRMLRILLDAGAQVADRDKHGDTALHLAARSGKVRAVEFLMQHGADFTLTNARGKDAVYEAVYAASPVTGTISPCAQVFMRYSADLSEYVKAGKLSQRDLLSATMSTQTLGHIYNLVPGQMLQGHKPTIKQLMTTEQPLTGRRLGLGQTVSAEDVKRLIDEGRLDREGMEMMEAEANKSALARLELEMVAAEEEHRKRVRGLLQKKAQLNDPRHTVREVLRRHDHERMKSRDPSGAAESLLTKSDVLERIKIARADKELHEVVSRMADRVGQSQGQQNALRECRLDKLAGVAPLSPSFRYTRSSSSSSSGLSSSTLSNLSGARSPGF